MALLRIKKVVTRQPHGVGQVDLCNPTTRGLVHYSIYNKGASTPRDLAVDLNADSVVGAGWTVNRHGRTYSTDSATTNSEIRFGYREDYDIYQTPFTVFWKGNVSSFVGLGAWISLRTAYASGMWSMYRAATGLLRFAVHNGTFYDVSSGYTTPASGDMAIAVRSDGAGNYTFDIIDDNGTSRHTAFLSGATPGDPLTHKLVVNNIQAGLANNYVRGAPQATGIFRRQLSDSEILSVLKNPYQLLKPRTILLPVVEVTDTEIDATLATLNITTYPASVALDVDVNAALATLNLTAYSASIAHDRNIDASLATLNITSYPATLTLDKNVQAALATLNLTTYPVSLTEDTDIAAALATLNLTTYPASISYDRNIAVSLATLNLTAYSASIAHDRNVAAALGTLNITSYPATLTFDRNVAAALGTLNITSYPATVVGGALIIPDVPGLEWTLPVNRLHYDIEGRAHYDLPVNRIHYDLKD